MSNMLSNCVKVYTSIDKPIWSVLQTEVHCNFIPRLYLQNRFDLAWTSCLFHFLCLSWLFTGTYSGGFDQITYLLQLPNTEATCTRGKYYSHPWGLNNTRKLYYLRLHTQGLILRACTLLCAATLKFLNQIR